jgi:hypothetical protein
VTPLFGLGLAGGRSVVVALGGAKADGTLRVAADNLVVIFDPARALSFRPPGTLRRLWAGDRESRLNRLRRRVVRGFVPDLHANNPALSPGMKRASSTTPNDACGVVVDQSDTPSNGPKAW